MVLKSLLWPPSIDARHASARRSATVGRADRGTSGKVAEAAAQIAEGAARNG